MPCAVLAMSRGLAFARRTPTTHDLRTARALAPRARRLNPDAEATYATFLELILPAMFDFPDRSS